MKANFNFDLKTFELRYAWSLSRNSVTSKTNGFIKAVVGKFTGLGEAAPNIRYGETPERLKEEFEQWHSTLQTVDIVHEWSDFLQKAKMCQALKCGLDMAVQNVLAQVNGLALSTQCGLPKAHERALAYTIPVMDPAEVKNFFEAEQLQRFSWLKLKVNQPLAFDLTNEVLSVFKGPIAIDGNEAWTDLREVLAFAKAVPKERILFLEQPLPAAQESDYIELGKHTQIPIWADESVLSTANVDFWKACFAGINVKLMKAGSIANAIYLLQTARNAGLQTMLGCMVETSVGIAAALSLESLADYLDLDGFMVLQQEPFGLVEESEGSIRIKA